MYFVGISLALLGLCHLAMSFSNSENASTCAEVFSKSAWGGMKPTKVTPRNNSPYYVMVHHTSTPACSSFVLCSMRLRVIQYFHMNALGLNDIEYSFLIGGDGRVYQGRGWEAQNSMKSRWYTNSLTIGFIGSFGNKIPSEQMMRAARRLVDCGKAEGLLPDYVKVIGLQQVVKTYNPADPLLYQLQKWPESMHGKP